MKTVYLINISYGLAGTEKRLYNIWLKLKERGNIKPILVIPLSLAIQFESEKQFNQSDKSIITIPENRLILWLSRKKIPSTVLPFFGRLRNLLVAMKCNRIINQIKTENEAIIHIGVPVSMLKPSNVPLVIECVDSGLDSFKRLYFKKLSKYYCIVNCQTDRIRDALDNVYKKKRTNWLTITSPCYFARYPQNYVTQNKKNPKKIAFVGRLTPIKNPELFIDAIKYVVSKNISVEAIILGEGPLLQLLLNKIDLLNLKEVIKIEFSAEPLSYLMESSIFTSLQKGDNYGSQSLLEAMGQSCAIVATNVGETGKLISDDVGILIDPTTEQLGEALIKLLLNPNLAYELGVNASTKATCQYNADKYIEYLEELYEKSLSLFNNPNTLY